MVWYRAPCVLCRATLIRFGVVFGSLSLSHAASVEWRTGEADGDGVVSHRGTLMEAANFGNAATRAPVVNGVPFAAIDFSAGQAPTHLAGLTYNTGENGKLPGPGVNELFDTIAYRSGANPQHAQLTGLVEGRDYEVQFFYYHDTVNRSVEIGDGTGQRVRLTETGEPLYATGIFQADAPTQTVTFDASTGSQFLNAYQVREIEPQPPLDLGQLVISEFVAANESGLLDGDGRPSDWIEIWNASSAPIDLAGWYLTDDLTEPTRWPFPAKLLMPDAYLVVFASGQSDAGYVDPEGKLHTTFKLDRGGGGTLALIRSLGTATPEVVWAFRNYPRQAEDVAYGLYGVTLPLAEGYLASPTPGWRNSEEGFVGWVDDVRCSPERGFPTLPIRVKASSPTEGSRIRYTTDGSEPTWEHGWDFPPDPGLAVSRTTVLRLAAFKTGYRPSRVQTHTYLFPSDVVEQRSRPRGFPTTWTGCDYGMEDDPADLARVAGDEGLGFEAAKAVVAEALKALPTLSLSMPVDDWFGPDKGIYSHPQAEGLAWERKVSAEWIEPGGDPTQDFQTDCGVRVQGFTSRNPLNNPKHSLRLVFRGRYGAAKLQQALFGAEGPRELDTIVLRSNSQDAWVYASANNRLGQFVRDEWNRRVFQSLGQPSPRGTWVHLYINGLYWGVYNPTERPDASFQAEEFGGPAEDYDVIKNHEEVLDGTGAAYANLLALIQVDPTDFDAGYRDLSTPADYAAVRSLVDLDNLADYVLHNVYSAAEDWPGNYYMGHDRTGAHGGWRFFDWDNEHGLKGSPTEDRSAPHWRDADSPTKFHHALRSNAEYRLLFADRLHRAFFNDGPLYVDPDFPAWDPRHPERNRPAALWMELTGALETALIAESARWGDYRQSPPYTVQGEFTALRAALFRDWFPYRSTVVMEQFRAAHLYPATAAPVFSQAGGAVAAGYRLTMTAPSGSTVYYTLDGTDPRVPWTSAVAPSATTYADGVPLTTSVRVQARARRRDEWSALNEALFIVGTPASAENLVIAELLYHPTTAGNTEFIELMNIAPMTVIDLSGVRLTGGITFDFEPATQLGPGERLAVVADPQAFDAHYGQGPRRLGPFTGKLDNAGETVVLIDATGAIIERLSYDDALPWPETPDLTGTSLTRIAPEHRLPSADPGSWRSSRALGGTPGSTDATRFRGDPLADADGDGRLALLEYTLATSDSWPDNEACLAVGNMGQLNSSGTFEVQLTVTIRRNLVADDVVLEFEESPDLLTWQKPVAAPSILRRTQHSDGTITEVLQCAPVSAGASRRFLRLALKQRDP